MINKHLRFNFAFFIVAAVQLFSEINPTPLKLVLGDFHYAIKPLIVIFLIAYLINNGGFKGRFKKRVMTGLFFGLIGDTLLMFTHVDELFFLLGVSSFLLGHLYYASAFYTDFKSGYTTKNYFLVPTAIVTILVFITFFYLSESFLGEFEIPVILYGTAISLMVITAASRFGKINTISFYSIFFGAILFMISDCILAYDKFIQQFTYAGFAVMASYISAQYLITIGTIERRLKKANDEGRTKNGVSPVMMDVTSDGASGQRPI